MSKQLLDTPAKHPVSIVGLIDGAWNFVAETAFRAGWTPAAKLCQAAVLAVLQNMTEGHLRVLTYSNSNIYTFPSLPQSEYDKLDGQNKAELRVVNDAFWVRLFALGDLGFAEAYMYGDVECDNLVNLFHIFLQNKDRLSNMDSRFSFLFSLPQRLTSYRFLNTIGNSRSNISAHYDISNDMFAGFLSEDMTYSCAIFKDLDGDVSDDTDRTEWNGGQGLRRLPRPISQATVHSNCDELREAQMRKLNHILNKAKINPGHRVLEIGSGWGSMAILIAQSVPDTTVDTLTLSVQQQTLARERIAKAGLQDRLTVHLMDYRNMPAHWEHAFDRVISIEMIEAVGAEFLTTYWQTVDWALKLKGAVGVVQVITIPEARKSAMNGTCPKLTLFANGYASPSFPHFTPLTSIPNLSPRHLQIFPGGFLPTLTVLLESLREGSSGRLTVDSVSNIGPHYARTLREWRRRFLDRFETVIVPALKAEHPEVMGGARGKEEIEVFKRKWIYYYCYCEVGFTTRTLGDHILTFTREGCQDYQCTVYE